MKRKRSLSISELFDKKMKVSVKKYMRKSPKKIKTSGIGPRSLTSIKRSINYAPSKRDLKLLGLKK